MLNNVPAQLNKANRMVTLRHPNALECTVLRKSVSRVSTDDPSEFAGLPTIGGLGVLDSEDEANYEYTEIGEAKAVLLGTFQTNGGNWNDADTSITYPDMPIVEALAECEANPGCADFFTIGKRDILLIHFGAGIVVPYEVVGETGSVNIPPYTRRFMLQPRSDQLIGI